MGRSLNGFVTLSSINFNYFGLEGKQTENSLTAAQKETGNRFIYVEYSNCC
jgi:hypothetical protein